MLGELKDDPDLRRIPVVILTTSETDRDVMAAYEHHANAYVRKPIDLQGLVQVVRQIDDFWLGIVTLPPR